MTLVIRSIFYILLLFTFICCHCCPKAAYCFDMFNEEFSEIFSLKDVEKLAYELAKKPFINIDSQTINFLRNISEDTWKKIFLKDEERLWREDNLPFEIGFIHPGFIYDQPVALYLVENGISIPIEFAPEMFEYQDLSLQGKTNKNDLNFAGFCLYYPLTGSDDKDEIISFLGATHFKALARHTVYGLTARGMILNPAQPEGEEFPYFRKFWIVKPRPDDICITIYALMDSPSMTGAFCFLIKPGTSTVVEVSVQLYPRTGVSLPKKIGLAPLGSMYLFSEKESGSQNDWRPEVHNSDNLLFLTSEKVWFRRPLNNPERLEINSFDLMNPQGFGLMQYDNNFDHYQDIAARFERRPSLWVEPLGDWGPGHLELIEIPSVHDINDNILASWISDQFFDQADTQKNSLQKPPYNFSYRLYWMSPGVSLNKLGRVASTRILFVNKREAAQFVIDFEGEELKAISADTGLTSHVETNTDTVIQEKYLLKNPVTGGWRLGFKLKLPKDNGVMQSIMSARGDRKSMRIQAFLKKGENLPEALTEIWVYDLSY